MRARERPMWASATPAIMPKVCSTAQNRGPADFIAAPNSLIELGVNGLRKRYRIRPSSTWISSDIVNQ